MGRQNKKKKKNNWNPENGLSYKKLLWYACREFGINPVSTVSPEVELAPIVAEQMGLPIPTEPRQRWDVLAAFYASDPNPRDGHTVINVDHIKPRRTYPDLALSKSNMQVLCSVCNHGKGNWSEYDWRQG